MRNYTETDLESHIEDYLKDNNSMISLSKAYKADKSIYDTERCILLNEFVHFIQKTQKDSWDDYCNQYSINPEERICERLNNQIIRRGLIDVLKNGFSDKGCDFKLLYFKPNSGMNETHKQKYLKNSFKLIRQLYFSPFNSDLSIDLVLFINGIPILTIELKNKITGQDNIDAEIQYSKRNLNEPLLQFKRCLVHFAVGTEKVSMCTNLKGKDSYFIPFNKDFENPVNKNGHKTSYLWEDILTKDSILDLINNFIHLNTEEKNLIDFKKNKLVKKTTTSLIFPRYHQLRAVRKLKEAILKEGVGHDYLIQHSTGSGKSLSIGWLSHLLITLFQDNNATARIFDSVIVVTDRKILDKQINSTLQQIDSRPGVVNKSTDNKKLYEYLSGGKDIIVTTVQKFPHLLKNFSKQINKDLKNKKFAVIIDEIHSSQFGKSHTDLRISLSENKTQEADDFDLESKILDHINSIQKRGNISFFGFSGTPTARTIQKFGRSNIDNIPEVFDLYSMDQSIKEKFTLNVLKNYTTYKRYFKLNENVSNDVRFEKSRIIKKLISYVDLHSYSIKDKTERMLDHFNNHTINKINGYAKAMVVASSREHCVKYKIEFDKQIKSNNLKFKTLVAFTGKITDKDTNTIYTESSLNGFSDSYTEEKFKAPDNKILIVNNKFQTGFDEPLLQTMYVDKKMHDLQMVQTLSRLNRTIQGKIDTFVLDFKNEEDDVKVAFQKYFKQTKLTGDIDPNVLYDLRSNIQGFNLFSQENIDDFLDIVYDEKKPQELISSKLDFFIESLNNLSKEEQEDFKTKSKSYVDFYSFLNEIISFKDINLHKLYIFLIYLIKKFPINRKEALPDLSEFVDLDYFRISKISSGEIKLNNEDAEIDPIKPKDKTLIVENEENLLSEIIPIINERFTTDFSDEHIVKMKMISKKLSSNEKFKNYFFANNSSDDKKYMFDKFFDSEITKIVNDDHDFYEKIQQPEINKSLKELLFKSISKKLYNDHKNK
ncbi:type I restriction endonuclease subunit R [Candidatus Pelagibacter sp.]|uniref:type I restriction endonuclease subunit R n=1 Tax=Candidatus Pelagibacter sp. TaxID=2024849 RepID=UPI003F84ED74